MNKYAIVTVGYNRQDCLLRLLNSLNNAEYDEDVPLIISLDNCGNDSVYNAVKNFKWEHGDIKVVFHEQRLGLKKHILSIGSWTDEYENVIVFEDDLYVSPYFFSYVKQCVEKYGDDDRIAGIGLYNNNLNQQTAYYYEAINDGFDVYFMQYACSWGQVWTKQKWNAFMEWYKDNDAPFYDDCNVPENVNRWNEKSWLKYHVKYCAISKKFFVFPRISLTTDFSSAGEHCKFDDNSFQIALLTGKKEWQLPTFDESNSKYDVFFENLELSKYLDIDENEVCIDTYGARKNSGEKRYWLTTKIYDYKILKSYALDLRPRDANIIYGIEGQFIKLYDTQTEEKYCLPLSEKDISYGEVHYITKVVSLKQLFGYTLHNIFEKYKKKILKQK